MYVTPDIFGVEQGQFGVFHRDLFIENAGVGFVFAVEMYGFFSLTVSTASIH